MKKERTRLQNTMFNMLTGFGGEILVYLLSFVSRTVFIHTLGKEFLGISGLFANILTMLSLAELGVHEAMNYRLYKPLKNNDKDKLAALMYFYKRVYQLVGFVVLALGIVLMPFLGYLIKDGDKLEQLGLNIAFVFFLYLVQSVSSYWFFAYKSAIVKAAQKEYYINIATYIGTIITNAAQIVVLIIFKDYVIYLIVLISCVILQNIINAIISDKMFPYLKQKPKFFLSKEERKDIFKDCGAISLFSISAVVLKATDNLVLSTFIGIEIVGLYSNYLMVYNALKKIIKRIFRSAEASLGNLFAGAESEIRHNYFLTVNYLMVIIGGTVSVCIAVLSDDFIFTWLNDEYVINMPFSLLIGIEMFTISMKLVLEQMRNVMGLFQQIKWRPVLSVILNVAISVSLVQICGIYGVLIGTIVSEWLTVFVFDPLLIYKHGFNSVFSVWIYYKKILLYIIELTAIGTANYFFVRLTLNNCGWLGLIIHSIVCFTSTFVFMLLVNIGKPEQKMVVGRIKQITKKIKRKKGKKHAEINNFGK